MRIHVDEQEEINELRLISKEGKDSEGQPMSYKGVRMYIGSPQQLHYAPGDDDRSMITLWIPRSKARRTTMANALHGMAKLIELIIDESKYTSER